MSSIISGVASYLPFRKAPPAEPTANSQNEADAQSKNTQKEETSNEPVVKNEFSADKKTDEVVDPSQQPGMLRRLGSGMYSVTTGTIGAGVGGVKWVAGKGYDAGAAVVGGTKAVVSKVSMQKPKDKKE